MIPAVTSIPTTAVSAKPDIKAMILARAEITITPTISEQLQVVMAANQQRAMEITLAVVSLDGHKPELFARDWPGVDLAVLLSNPAAVASVDAWAENPVVENYARALQERRMATKAMSILESSIDEGGTTGQAMELLDLLTKGRQVRDPDKPVRRMQYVFGQANSETPFGKTTINVHGCDPGEAFISICAAMYVRDDDEVAAVLDCLRNPMSRITLAGW